MGSRPGLQYDEWTSFFAGGIRSIQKTFAHLLIPATTTTTKNIIAALQNG